MTFAHEYLAHHRQQELVRDAQRARLLRCLQPSARWRRRRRQPCSCP